ncbi:MAG: hypothetical protein ACJ72E_15155 [Marmoricola sp.]
MKPTLIGLVLCSALVSGCSSGHRAAEPHPTRTTYAPQAEGRTWVPLRGAAPATEVPTPPTAPPTLDALRAARGDGPTRLGAEQFAVVVEQALTDARPGLDGQDVVDVIAAPDLPEVDRRSTAGDIDSMNSLGWRRRLDEGTDTWIRSSTSGPATGPTHLVVEVAGYVVVGTEPEGSWEVVQLGILRHGASWQVDSIISGARTITTRRHLDPRTDELTLPGTGWRRIPPASP